MNRVALILIVLAMMLMLIQARINYKRDYCDGQTYVSKRRGNNYQYPHIHCGKDFMVYSEMPEHHKHLSSKQAKKYLKRE
jgi:hypothetical protein